jgi:Asp-tRNA(Asn)/Glu-tRNA(Gln) amidotransferase A subunit family amidase
MRVERAGDELLDAPAWRQREALLRGEVGVRELVAATLDRIGAVDADLHSFAHVDADAALAEADRLDRERGAGAEPGPLFGAAVSVKDLFHVAGMPTAAGSLVYRGTLAQEDSVHAARVRAAGAIVVGKTNTPEFGVFPRTVNRLQPETVNPWDRGRISGGSSGGSAASVAARLTPIAVGSDAGGSVRIPAALCGVAGMLPSRGLVPRHGGVVGTLLFSTAGPVAADVRDLATLLQVLAGPHPADPFAWTSRPPDLLRALDAGIADVRLQWLARTGVAEADSRVAGSARTAARELAAAEGAVLLPGAIELDAARWQEPFYAMMAADRYAAIGEAIDGDPGRRALLSDYGAAAFERARGVTGADYSRALAARYAARAEVLALFSACDLLVSPTTCVVAPRVTEEVRREPLIAFTNFCNLTGLPAATVPCGRVDGLPVGLQVIGPPGADALVLRACRAFERLHPVELP